MRIGIDARFWNESGVGRYVRNLVWELEKIDKKNTYVLFATKENHIKLKNPNWKIVTTDIHWHSLEEQIKLPKILNQENLDLMHFPYFSIPIFYNKPFVVTIHDLILHHFSTGEATTRHPIIYHGKRLGYKYIIKQAAQKSKKIITVSNVTKQEIIKHLKVPPEKIIVTYEGIDDSLKTPPFLPKPYTLNPISYFLHIGNLYPHKNMEIVLKALHKLKKEDNISIPLVIVGKEDYFYKKFQKKVKELEIETNMKFLGEVTEAQLQNLYQNALGLISPSLMEGFDLPTIEAMANNCLVLASDIPIHREICKDAAIYFNQTNREDIIKILKEVYNNGKEKYKEKIKKAKTLTNQFNWEKMSKETLQVYEHIIG